MPHKDLASEPLRNTFQTREAFLGFPLGAQPIPPPTVAAADAGGRGGAAGAGAGAVVAPWARELDHATLGPFFSRNGGFGP